jgi:putative ABC transport system ATP-binding protein
MLFQTANLIQHLNVAQNVSLVQSLSKRSRTDRPDVLRLVGLQHRRRAYPGQLSGGELALAGLAVALANQPTVLLADEPTAEVDSTAETRVIDLIVDAAPRGTAVVVACHSTAVAAAATRTLRLDDGRLSA